MYHCPGSGHGCTPVKMYRCSRVIYTYSRTLKQTPHVDTRSEINPSRTRVKNEIMKTFKSAQNIGNRARKCIWHCFSCEMGYLSTRLRSFTRLKGSWKISETCAEINPSRTRNNAICISRFCVFVDFSAIYIYIYGAIARCRHGLNPGLYRCSHGVTPECQGCATVSPPSVKDVPRVAPMCHGLKTVYHCSRGVTTVSRV